MQRIAYSQRSTPKIVTIDDLAPGSKENKEQDKSGAGVNGGEEGGLTKQGNVGDEAGSGRITQGATASKPAVTNASGTLTSLSSKFCSPTELSYLQQIMSTGDLAGRSTTEFYTIGKVVGVGSFAKVRLGWHKLTGQAIAIKTYEKSKMKDASHLRRVQQEIKVMEKLNHPRLIRLFETLESPKRIHLIMEFVSAGNLCSYVKRRRRLPEEEARKIFHQICIALDYMHECEIIHRDVKLENVLLDKDGNSKLIDFGFSVFSKDKKALKVFCGTPSYMAPEIVRRIEYDGKPIDAWSLGVVLYALVCGCFPFSAKSYPELYKKIMRGQFKMPDALSHSLKDLISSLLTLEPRKRCTVSAAKNHPWVHNGKNGTFRDADAWTCDPGCSEILISKHAKNDLNESVLKTLDEFGIKRDVAIHNTLNKAHNGINTCYYLLKQAMKDNGSLVENGAMASKLLQNAGGKTTISAAAYTGSGGGAGIRPLSAPTNAGIKNKRPGYGGVVSAAAAARNASSSAAVGSKAGSSAAEEEDSFIKDDDDDGSDNGGEEGRVDRLS
jgi:serine/threonine protein kinase